MGNLIKADKADFVGRDAALALLADAGPDGRQVLTGFETSGSIVPQEGAAIVRDGRAVGRVTSARFSPTLGHPIGLAWLAADAATEGEPITIRVGVGTAGETVEGRVRRGPFYDPEGTRPRT